MPTKKTPSKRGSRASSARAYTSSSVVPIPKSWLMMDPNCLTQRTLRAGIGPRIERAALPAERHAVLPWVAPRRPATRQADDRLRTAEADRILGDDVVP